MSFLVNREDVRKDVFMPYAPLLPHVLYGM